MRHLRLAAPALFAAVLAACATTGSRIKKHQAAFDAYPPAVQEKIREGKVDVGFTQEQAAMALGKPDRIYHRKNQTSEQEVWSYGRGGYSGVGFGFGMMTGGPVSIGTVIDAGPGPEPGENMRVVFQGGTVVSVESRQ